jgi:hypothetical protein
MNNPSWHEKFHTLWTKAVGTPDYVKKEWLDLEAEFVKLQREVDNRKE